MTQSFLKICTMLLVVCGFPLLSAPKADAFIFRELKAVGRVVKGVVTGVTNDVRATGRAVKNSVVREKSESRKVAERYQKNMREAQKQRAESIRKHQRNNGNDDAKKRYEKMQDAAKRQSKAHEKAAKAQSKQVEQRFKSRSKSDAGVQRNTVANVNPFTDTMRANSEKRKAKRNSK